MGNNTTSECLKSNMLAYRFIYYGSGFVLLSVLPPDKHLSFAISVIGVFSLALGLIRLKVNDKPDRQCGSDAIAYLLAALIFLLAVIQFVLISLPWSSFDREANALTLLSLLLSKYSAFIIVAVLAMVMGSRIRRMCRETEDECDDTWGSQCRMALSNVSVSWSSLQRTTIVFVIFPCVFLLLFYLRFLLDGTLSFGDYVHFSHNGNVEYAEHLLAFVLVAELAPFVAGVHLLMTLRQMGKMPNVK